VYAAVSYLIEIAPSGAINALHRVLPFDGLGSIWENSAEIIDVFRAVIIILYILLFRVYFATKRKVVRGKSGLSYVFSFYALLDMTICALFIGLQAERIYHASFFQSSSIPDLNAAHTGHYLYTLDGWIFSRFFIVEACLLFTIIARWCTFMAIIPVIRTLWQTFARSTKMFLNYVVIFLPLMVGLMFLANAIWHPYVEPLSRWDGTGLYILRATVNALPIEQLYESSRIWTMVFLVYFFFSMTLFFINGFLAITVHSYFEETLLDHNDEKTVWDSDKLLDWMLWGFIYKKVTGNEPGSSFDDVEDSEDDEDDESDEGEEDIS